jgi:hypothetical protein
VYEVQLFSFLKMTFWPNIFYYTVLEANTCLVLTNARQHLDRILSSGVTKIMDLKLWLKLECVEYLWVGKKWIEHHLAELGESPFFYTIADCRMITFLDTIRIPKSHKKKIKRLRLLSFGFWSVHFKHLYIPIRLRKRKICSFVHLWLRNAFGYNSVTSSIEYWGR